MSAASDVTRARVVLAGSMRNRNRMACWITRAALEQVIRNLLEAKGRPTGEARTATLLTCLEVAYATSPEIAERAEFAWARLSNACHQHAFELSPTASEAARLIEVVDGLVAAHAQQLDLTQASSVHSPSA